MWAKKRVRYEINYVFFLRLNRMQNNQYSCVPAQQMKIILNEIQIYK